MAELVIERNDGCDGRVTVRFKTKDITAIAGKDYEVCDNRENLLHLVCHCHSVLLRLGRRHYAL